MKIGIATDHGGFDIYIKLKESLQARGHLITDFGNDTYDPGDDFPDFVIPLAKAVAAGEVERGIAICGSGVGASIAACKVPGVRAALIHDLWSARQGVEDDDMNVLCMGGRVIDSEMAVQLCLTFLNAGFSKEPRFVRRLKKIEERTDELWNKKKENERDK
ncbi:hypothetical protein MASR1M74_27430 [Lentimicrobium sp.]